MPLASVVMSASGVLLRDALRPRRQAGRTALRQAGGLRYSTAAGKPQKVL